MPIVWSLLLSVFAFFMLSLETLFNLEGWLHVGNQKLESWDKIWRSSWTDWCSSFRIWRNAGALQWDSSHPHQCIVCLLSEDRFTCAIVYLFNSERTWMRRSMRRQRRKPWNSWVNLMTRWRKSWQETWHLWMNSVGCSWYGPSMDSGQ